jgi:hypothetical protein
MQTKTIHEWLLVGTAIYGKVDSQFTQIVALDNAMPIKEGMAIRYSNDLTYVLGTPLGRV